MSKFGDEICNAGIAGDALKSEGFWHAPVAPIVGAKCNGIRSSPAVLTVENYSHK